MEEHHIDIISIEDIEYPQILKEIDNPPLNLYIKGNKNIFKMPAIAVVGCREATEYGKNVAQTFAYNLAKNGFCIVSGLARGIDAFAHLGAVKFNRIEASNFIEKYKANVDKNKKNFNEEGKTIAVLGNGLDTIYPTENANLAKQILNTGGAIISEYPLGSRSKKRKLSC